LLKVEIEKQYEEGEPSKVSQKPNLNGSSAGNTLKIEIQEGEGTEHINEELDDLGTSKILAPPYSVAQTLNCVVIVHSNMNQRIQEADNPTHHDMFPIRDPTYYKNQGVMPNMQNSEGFLP
jgi:hypothetical protein